MKNPAGMMTRQKYQNLNANVFISSFLLRVSVQFLHRESAQEKRKINAGMLF
jgi:hypothetical protein